MKTNLSNAFVPFTREELQWIRTKAGRFAGNNAATNGWERAYEDLSDAANKLDAMIARGEYESPILYIGETISICKNCGKPSGKGHSIEGQWICKTPNVKLFGPMPKIKANSSFHVSGRKGNGKSNQQ